MHAMGATRVAHRILVGHGTVVLNYHHADRAGLHAQLDYLKDRFNIVSLHAALRSRRGVTKPQVVLTFDDGYRDTYTDAFPVLRAAQVPASVFLVTGFTGGGRAFWWDCLDAALSTTDPTELQSEGRLYWLRTAAERRSFRKYLSRRYCELPADDAEAFVRNVLDQLGQDWQVADRAAILSWPQVTEMYAGGIEFESHTQTHPILSQVQPDRLKQELVASRHTLLEQLGCEAKFLAYPHGQPRDVSDLVLSETLASGYTAALSTVPRAVRPGDSCFMLPRVPADTRDPTSVFALKLHGLWPLIQWVRAMIPGR